MPNQRKAGKRQVGAHLEGEMYERVRRIARRMGMSVSDTVIRALSDFLAVQDGEPRHRE